MATLVQLEAEPWWGAEREAPAHAAFNAGLRAHYGLGRDLIGSKGDANHLRGRHRSRAWSRNSRFCTDRAYGDLDARDKAGDGNWLRASDIGITGDELRAASRRVDAAVRSGRLPCLAEWYGTFDGREVVGWYQGHASSSDSSHLYHLHVGLWTSRCDDAVQLALLAAIITGEDDMALTKDDAVALFGADILPAPEGVEQHPDTNPTWAFTSWLRFVLLPILVLVKGIDGKLDQLLAALTPTDLPPVEHGEFTLADADVERIAASVADRLAARLKD